MFEEWAEGKVGGKGRKTELCRFWQSPKGCSQTKETCNFAHGEADMQLEPKIGGKGKKKGVGC